MGMKERFMKRNPFKKTRPEITLAFSFLIVILVGSFLLTLDISNNNQDINYIDALFTATTSTCVTGLVTVVPADQFTIFGQIVVLLLIQIGGLGLMTFVSVLLLFMHAKLDFREKMLLKDALSKEDFHGVGSYIKAIVRYTFFFEFLGFILIFTQLYRGDNILLELFQSLFLSVSAFCNAGIDILGPNSLVDYQTNLVINLVVPFLIIMGGLGFAVWFDVAHNLRVMHNLKKNIKYFFEKLRINTKVVLIVTFFLITFGAVMILILEYHNSLSHLGLFDKILASFFNSVTLRTAGFFTIDFTILHDATKLVMIALMFIGGSPGGTAGGIKTTTLFLLIYSALTIINDRNTVSFFKREVHYSYIIKAFVVFLLYISLTLVSSFFISIFENQEFIDILFEVVSALATVGLTTGITTSLCTASKIIIILLMFIGRVGPITIALSLRRRVKADTGVRYPATDIVVG